MVSCNTTLADEKVDEVPYSYGLTFHQSGLIVSAVFAVVAILISVFLIIQHARHYSKPWEQKHIIRILFLIPIYSAVSFLSYYYYEHAIYFEVLRDCYEAFAIASFFTLLCHYVAPNLHDQKDFFRSLKPVKNWVLPVNWMQKCTGGIDKGLLRRPSSGLTWFNIIWIAVFQYCAVRILFTIVSVIAEATNRYCEASLSPAFAHIWVLAFEGASVSVAMYALIQFYIQLKDEIAEHRPFLKILSIKLVIFFSFWQNLLISFLSSARGPLRPTEHISYPDIKVGIPSMLLTLEMAIFATLHVFAFPYKRPYSIPDADAPSAIAAHGLGFSGKPSYKGGPLGLSALADAFNPWDIVKASARGWRWLFVGVKHRREDRSYAPDYHSGLDAATKLAPMPGSGPIPMDDNYHAHTSYDGPAAYGAPPPFDHRGYPQVELHPAGDLGAGRLSPGPSESGIGLTPSPYAHDSTPYSNNTSRSYFPSQADTAPLAMPTHPHPHLLSDTYGSNVEDAVAQAQAQRARAYSAGENSDDDRRGLLRHAQAPARGPGQTQGHTHSQSLTPSPHRARPRVDTSPYRAHTGAFERESEYVDLGLERDLGGANAGLGALAGRHAPSSSKGDDFGTPDEQQHPALRGQRRDRGGRGGSGDAGGAGGQAGWI